MALFKRRKQLAEGLAIRVQSALDKVGKQHPDARISGLTVTKEGQARFTIETPRDKIEVGERLRLEAEQTASSIDGVTGVTAVLTAMAEPGSQPPSARPAAKPSLPTTHRHQKGEPLPSAPASPQSGGQPNRSALQPIPGVGRIVAITSAKGGVGKSTLTVNLAAALSQLGLRVGVLDTDVYGPSLPTMMGTANAKPETAPSGKLQPIEAHGLKTMSIGYVADTDAPMIWRGPVVMSAVTQMLNDVEWGQLDILLLDTPPGTGDIQLSLAQRFPISGVVIVSTPQDVALADVRRGVAMFRKTEVPVLGLVENMAWFEDQTGARIPIFGEKGAQTLAAELDLAVLGEVPIVPDIRVSGDEGRPFATADQETVFTEIAKALLAALDTLEEKPAPEIVFED